MFVVTQQITMEYAGKNTFSEAKGKWKYTWNLPILVINRYLKQRFFTASKPGKISLYMQEKYRQFVTVRV